MLTKAASMVPPTPSSTLRPISVASSWHDGGATRLLFPLTGALSRDCEEAFGLDAGVPVLLAPFSPVPEGKSARPQCRHFWTTDVRDYQSVESEVLGPCSTVIDRCRHTHPCPRKERDIGIIAAGRPIASEAADRATPDVVGAMEEGVRCVVVVRFIITIRGLSFGRIFERKRLTRRTLLQAGGSAPC